LCVPRPKKILMLSARASSVQRRQRQAICHIRRKLYLPLQPPFSKIQSMAEIKFHERESAVSILRVLIAKGQASRPLIQVLFAFGSVIVMTSASACTAHPSAAPAGIGFVCGVDNTKMISPVMGEKEVCAFFKAKTDDALKQKTVAMGDEVAALPANWLKLEVRFSMPGTASAIITQSKSGKKTIHPEIAVDVMDKAMGPSDVKTLAAAVGQYLADTAKQ
jgi:hypothetical protein